MLCDIRGRLVASFFKQRNMPASDVWLGNVGLSVEGVWSLTGIVSVCALQSAWTMKRV